MSQKAQPGTRARAWKEHELVDSIIAQLEAVDLGSDDFEGTVRVLKEPWPSPAAFGVAAHGSGSASMMSCRRSSGSPTPQGGLFVTHT